MRERPFGRFDCSWNGVIVAESIFCCDCAKEWVPLDCGTLERVALCSDVALIRRSSIA